MDNIHAYHEEFDVNKIDEYIAKVKRARAWLKEYQTVGDKGFYLLPSGDIANVVDFPFRTPKSSVFFRLQAKSLMMLGYGVRKNDTVKWFEFNRSDQIEHYIAESEFLGFSCNYNDMVPNYRRANLALGKYELKKAIDTLANPKTKNVDKKEPLVVIIELFPEILRFRSWEHLLFKSYDYSRKPSSSLISQQNNWKPLSVMLLNVLLNRGPFKEVEGTDIHNTKTARKAVAMLLVPKDYDLPPPEKLLTLGWTR